MNSGASYGLWSMVHRLARQPSSVTLSTLSPNNPCNWSNWSNSCSSNAKITLKMPRLDFFSWLNGNFAAQSGE